MAGRTPVYSTLLVVLAFAPQPGLTAHVPQIISPGWGSLSFSEMFLQAFQSILDLGFVQGVVSGLLILGCLTCLLICVLCALAAYFDRVDKGRWDKDLELNEDYVSSSPPHTKRHSNRTSRSIRRGRKSHYLSRPPVVTKISVVASPFSCQSELSSSSSPPSPPRYHSQDVRTSTSPPTTPLRSALSNSPPPTCQRRSLVLGVKRTPSSGSPKSVRWADELGVAVLATVQVTSSREGPDWEIDIGMTRPQSASATEENSPLSGISTGSPPIYTGMASDLAKS
ncbi:hypothetical protein PV08_03316 [Exophiala spinifera]|uniref:Uncharacterized protein n=1 Tax=Exophiala spinifera TaxID=91928 RepID=A0A0D1YUV0_9EURO|nr:uncharacterized protein PV08_03316 [Exophiala spinifera]KIW19026.1 hypothetical protein PV08_03316 [Exophiala spinifera]